MSPNDMESRRPRRRITDLGWKRIAVILVATVALVPILLVILRVMAAPLLSIPVIVVIGAIVIAYLMNAAHRSSLPDKHDHHQR